MGKKVFVILFLLVSLALTYAEQVWIVNNSIELLAALKESEMGDIVIINNDINLSGNAEILIPAGVTLKGNGVGIIPDELAKTKELEEIEILVGEFSSYPLIYTDRFPGEKALESLFVIGGDNVAISGLRIRGESSEIGEKVRVKRNVAVRNSGYGNLSVFDCELYNWQYAAIRLDNKSRDNSIKNSYIHHNRGMGLGYGIVHAYNAYSVIENNYFDYNRHDIAASGEADTGYEARFNVSGKHGIGHSFDMHGGADRGDGSDIAGEYILIEHNVFHISSFPAVMIRGIPTERANIRNNQFRKLGSRNEAIRQYNAYGSIYTKDNDYMAISDERKGYWVLWSLESEPQYLLNTVTPLKDIKIGDFNGDGVDDIFSIRKIDGKTEWVVSWSAISSWQIYAEFESDFDDINKAYIGSLKGYDVVYYLDNSKLFLFDGEKLTLINSIPHSPSKIYPVFMSSREKSDIIYQHNNDLYMLQEWRGKPEIFKKDIDEQFWFADINGDGFSELIRQQGKYLVSQDGVILHEAAGDSIAFADFTGDGKSNLFTATGERWKILLPELFLSKQKTLKIDEVLFGDFNGDGKKDIIYRR